jgi:hypothetical protein
MFFFATFAMLSVVQQLSNEIFCCCFLPNKLLFVESILVVCGLLLLIMNFFYERVRFIYTIRKEKKENCSDYRHVLLYARRK